MKTGAGCILAAALLGGALSAASALPVEGVGGLSPRVPQPRERLEPRISPAQAAAQARQQHGGKVLDVRLERAGVRPYYRVKLLKDGTVRSVRVPAD
jgi:uncharacterized membrane protein YkoI